LTGLTRLTGLKAGGFRHEEHEGHEEGMEKIWTGLTKFSRGRYEGGKLAGKILIRTTQKSWNG
jgi:hypothetical protein